MKKLLSLLLIFVLIFSVSACKSTDTTTDDNDNTSDVGVVTSDKNAQLFFDKILENKKLIDPIFSSVCSAWKTAQDKENATVSDVNAAINNALSEHSEAITTISENDNEIATLYELAKNSSVSTNVEEVMVAYVTYEESVLNADASTNPGGYTDASTAKNSLGQAMRNFRTAIGS